MMKLNDRVTNDKGWTGVIVEVRQRNQPLMFSDGNLKAGPIYCVNWRERENCPESHPNYKAICKHSILPHRSEQIWRAEDTPVVSPPLEADFIPYPPQDRLAGEAGSAPLRAVFGINPENPWPGKGSSYTLYPGNNTA